MTPPSHLPWMQRDGFPVRITGSSDAWHSWVLCRFQTDGTIEDDPRGIDGTLNAIEPNSSTVPDDTICWLKQAPGRLAGGGAFFIITSTAIVESLGQYKGMAHVMVADTDDGWDFEQFIPYVPEV
jgi:hypothetical protein